MLVRGATLSQPGLDDFMRSSYQAMYTISGRGPLTFTGPAFARYHGVCNEESEALVEACLPFSATAAQPRHLPEGMYVLDIPEAPCAATTVEGAQAAFPEIHSAYDAVAGWITDHGFSFAGPVREIYHRWNGTPGHPDNRLEIAWPIRESPAPEPGSAAEEGTHEA